MILITGGGGFLGLNLARYLADQGEDVLLLGRRPVQAPSFLSTYWGKEVRNAVGDILDLPCLCRIIQEYRVESIIHGAYLHEGKGSHLQVLKVNLEGTANLLEAVRIFGLRRISFISSSTVYHGAQGSSFHEGLPLPVPSDGMIETAKKAGEQICLFYARDGLGVVIVRPPRIYGPLYHSRRIPIQGMVEGAVAHQPVDLPHVFGESRSNYVYVKDCVQGIALVHLAQAPRHRIYNVGEDVSYRYSDFAEAIKEVIPGAVIRLGAVRTAKDVDVPPLDVTRIKEEMGFVVHYDLRRGVRDYIEWVKNERRSDG